MLAASPFHSTYEYDTENSSPVNVVHLQFLAVAVEVADHCEHFALVAPRQTRDEWVHVLTQAPHQQVRVAVKLRAGETQRALRNVLPVRNIAQR